MKIWLVRHGLSEANKDFSVYSRQADHTIPLTEEGMGQSREAGKFLTKDIDYRKSSLYPSAHVRIWRSPYLRARQTSDLIQEALERHGCSVSQRENIALREQHFGVWTGLSESERKERFPHESALYDRAVEEGGRFWAPVPCGESQAQVADRIQSVFGAIHHDRELHGIDNVIIVGHGIAIQCAIMQWMRYPYEWLSTDPHPRNCEIRLVNRKRYRGTVFGGFKSPRVPDL